MPTRVIAFDVFDTLVHPDDRRVTNFDVQLELERFGISISYQAYEAARQGVFFFDACKRPIQGWVDFLALLFHRMGEKVSLDIIESLAAMHESRNDMVLFPDALEALKAVRRRGLTLCAFTTLPRFMLGRANDTLAPLLDHYFDASEIMRPKGDRRYYSAITERLGTASGDILCVGDDPLCDVRLPAREGWRAVLLDRKGRYNGPDSIATLGAAGTIRSLNELLRYAD